MISSRKVENKCCIVSLRSNLHTFCSFLRHTGRDTVVETLLPVKRYFRSCCTQSKHSEPVRICGRFRGSKLSAFATTFAVETFDRRWYLPIFVSFGSNRPKLRTPALRAECASPNTKLRSSLGYKSVQLFQQNNMNSEDCSSEDISECHSLNYCFSLVLGEFYKENK